MPSRALIARWLTVLSVAFSATACGQPRRAPSQPADIYAALRNAVINLDIGQILPEPAVSDLEVRMMLVDIGVAGGTATVMVAADG